MRNLLLASVAAATLVVAGPVAAQTATFCVNCSTEVQEAIRFAQEFANQLQQLEAQVQAVQWAIQNTLSLPGRLINDITSPIYQAQALVRQAEMMGQQTKWMISNLGAVNGYGGSLADIPLALRQEDNALANAMQQLGLVSHQVGTLSTQCAAQYAAVDSIDPGGIKAATMVGTTMAATAGQCAEARAQLHAAYQNAMATAALRQADRESLLSAKAAQNARDGVAATCRQLTTISPPVCRQQAGPGGGGQQDGTTLVASQ